MWRRVEACGGMRRHVEAYGAHKSAVRPCPRARASNQSTRISRISLVSVPALQSSNAVVAQHNLRWLHRDGPCLVMLCTRAVFHVVAVWVRCNLVTDHAVPHGL